jgi:hypothetical protein
MFIIPIPQSAQAKPAVFFIPPEIFLVCAPQLESCELPTVSLHVESFRKKPKAYGKQTAVACFPVPIPIPLHIDDIYCFVWSVLFEGGVSNMSEGSAHETTLAFQAEEDSTAL